ncbi:MAG: hypothetical protein ABIA62_04980 [Candidatus Woesearchaeota archaeon]
MACKGCKTHGEKTLTDVLHELGKGQLVWLELETGLGRHVNYYEEAMGFVDGVSEKSLTLAGMKIVAGNTIETNHRNTYPLGRIHDIAVIPYDGIYARDRFEQVRLAPIKEQVCGGKCGCAGQAKQYDPEVEAVLGLYDNNPEDC